MNCGHMMQKGNDWPHCAALHGTSPHEAQISPKRRPVFSYGSNSVAQLRGRLLDESLQGHASFIPGMDLAFCGPNKGWAHASGQESCGTATLEKRAEGVAYGSVVFLSEEQLLQLDKFEGAPAVYQRREEQAFVWQDREWRSMNVLCYVKANSTCYDTPTEAYRCAVLRNLRGSFQDIDSIQVSMSPQVVWTHPGYHRLGIPAFLFEVGVRMRPPWKMPRAISDHMAQLQKHFGREPKSLHEVVEFFEARSECRAEERVAKALLLLDGQTGSCSDDGGGSTTQSTQTEALFALWQRTDVHCFRSSAQRMCVLSYRSGHRHSVGSQL